MKTGKLIKDLRIKKGLTQEQLAAKTELSARTIQRIENGEVDPRAYTLQMIANALEVDFRLFVDEDKENGHTDNNKEHANWLALLHLSGIFLIFVPTLIIYQRKKNEIKEIGPHFKEVISFQLTLWVFIIIPGLLMYYFFSTNNIVNKAPYYILIGIGMGIFFSVRNAILVMNGKDFKPLNIFKLNEEKK